MLVKFFSLIFYGVVSIIAVLHYTSTLITATGSIAVLSISETHASYQTTINLIVKERERERKREGVRERLGRARER